MGQNQHYLQIMQEDHAKTASVGCGLNTVTELANISESQSVSNDLYKRVLETTSTEELARNTPYFTALKYSHAVQ